ncbi:MAG: hypothetical protein HON14_16205 [Rhodospirillaceae bacterium]|jgi:hypothetical protein|nr:hypothetical protein [Rhodospirillaceae bacterium]MBT4590210.1 hypothetical protein [Rhodospirillaceae bacterium]MBT4940681.1 hypothetical protein [Rhodospirillaceae bacterium]MBT5941826.1 hypothetical protein [Rhodospirillaceae bacterium]MBT7268758.1 hypothetical protein [Rhodospirillaceae bacterium]
MALTPRIAGTNLIPSGGGRFAATGAVANVDPAQLTELNQINALIYEGQSEFQYDQFDARKQQSQTQRERRQYDGARSFDRFGRPVEQVPARRINNAMLENSSESFAKAFNSIDAQSAPLSGEPPRYQPNTSLEKIINSYETTAQVIYDEVPPKGENLSLTL